MTSVKKHPRLVILWLSLCTLLVVCMVAVGGYTRLSGSGLSITEWKPIHGAIPPMNQAEWQEEFDKYKQIPQYAEVNKGMSLSEFKTIYWPEFLHRLLGRTIGIVFLLPLVFFWASGSISHRFGLRLTAIFALGGVQGFMGWYMVSSGLIENIYVSHLRLAAHLILALALLGLIIWATLDMAYPARSDTPKTGFNAWFALLCLQILYGAFMAGLHAGLLYNTWPDMNGKMLPDGLWEPELGLINLFENRATVQFIHRWLAVILALGFGFWWFLNRTYVKQKKLARYAASIAFVIALQFLLGVLTLVNEVPLSLGLIHQMTAVLLFMLSVVVMHRLGK
jgi:cytochrome c oxidase assembly protein subunit 15